MPKSRQLLLKTFNSKRLSRSLKSYVTTKHDAKAISRKQARPFSPRCLQHVVLKSNHVTYLWSFTHKQNRKNVEKILIKQAQKHQVQLRQFSINSNHLHLLVKAKEKTNFSAFLSAIAGLIARAVTGVEKGQSLGMSFWQHRPFSRLVAHGMDWTRVSIYIFTNIKEAFGEWKYGEYRTPSTA